MSNVYSAMKLFHHRDKLDSLENETLTPPVYVRLKPTNFCNHNCWYCCYRNENLFLSQKFNPRDMIPREAMRGVVRDFVKMGVKAVTFSGGGEPLIYPHIDETIKGLLDGGVKIATLTNGSCLKGSTAHLLAGGATWVRVSMDGCNADQYASMRGVGADEFKRVIKNVEAFAAEKKSNCELGVNLIVTESNNREIYSFIRDLKSLGVNHVKVSECIVSTEGTGNNKYHEGHFSRVKEQVSRASSDLTDENFRVIDKFHDFDDKFDKTYKTCPHIQFQTILAADQNVYTCHDKAYTESGLLGSIRDIGFEKLWFSKETAKRLGSLNPSKECCHHCAEHGKNLLLLDYLNVNTDHMDFV